MANRAYLDGVYTIEMDKIWKYKWQKTKKEPAIWQFLDKTYDNPLAPRDNPLAP